MRQALEMALEALKRATNYDPVIARAITAIKEALAQPEHTWISLTDEERKDLCRSWPSPMDAIYATESKLKDKNK